MTQGSAGGTAPNLHKQATDRPEPPAADKPAKRWQDEYKYSCYACRNQVIPPPAPGPQPSMPTVGCTKGYSVITRGGQELFRKRKECPHFKRGNWNANI